MTSHNPQRDDEIAKLYLDGLSAREIAQMYGCSHQNIRQMLKRLGLSSANGGPWIKAREKMKERAKEVENRYFARWGITKAEGKLLAPCGSARHDSPMNVFWTKRANARKHGVEWQLSFVQWWDIWVKSGKWEERGRGKYVMGRRDNSGPFSAENSLIMSQSEASKRSFILKPGKYRAELAIARKSSNVQRQS